MTAPNAAGSSVDSELPAPAETEKPMSEKELAESKAYGRRELQVTLADMVIDFVFLSLVAIVFAKPIDQWLQSWPILENNWLRLGAMFLLVMTAHYSVSFPLSFYSGFILEHQFKLSHQTIGRWFRRYMLQNSLAMVLGLALILGLFGIIWWTGSYWWLVAAGASFVATALLGQLLPVLILPLFYKVEKLDDQELVERFRHLSEGTSLKIEGVYRMKLSTDTAKANAMLAGLGRTRRVILGDTLLDDFTTDEIEVVLAHEVGHHVFHHITKLIVLGLIYSATSFLICDLVLVGWNSAQRAGFDYSQMPVAALPMIIFIVTLCSTIFGPIRNSICRRFEHDCDQYALDATEDRVAYRSAFTKLAKLNKSDPDPHTLEVLLFHDHPPISARLAMANEGQ